VDIVLLLAAAAILGGVLAVAMGRGGELAVFSRDVPVAPIRARTPADVAMLRLPLGLFGYQQQATADALRAVAGLLDERDAEINRLRDEIWRLGLRAGPDAPVPDAPVPDAPVQDAPVQDAPVQEPSTQP
jgi:hypothetical protein